MDIEAEMSQRATPLVHGTNIPHLINDEGSGGHREIVTFQIELGHKSNFHT